MRIYRYPLIFKPHLHGRVLAARIDILSFFFLKSRRSLTRAQDSREILSARYRQTRNPKNQIAAVTHTGEILPRRSHTVATRRSHLHVETACQ